MKTGKTLIDLVRMRLGGSTAKKTNLERKGDRTRHDTSNVGALLSITR
jgi:hypothetical protein